MNTTPTNQQDDKDQKLLQRLLLVPVKRPTRTQRVSSFFSHPAWQSAGAIIGFLSLIVTVILTIYVYNLGHQQQMAYISYAPYSASFGEVGENHRFVSWDWVYYNNGPAAGRGVLISVVAENDIDCNLPTEVSVSKGLPPIVLPTKTQFSSHRCEFFYDYFYSGYATLIHITEKELSVQMPITICNTPSGCVNTAYASNMKSAITGENVTSAFGQSK